MAVYPGKRYVSPSGAEVIVTKGGDGQLYDGEVPMLPKEQAGQLSTTTVATKPAISVGSRYRSGDAEVEVLVLKAGVCDLRYNEKPMERMQPKVLPSAD